MSTDPRPMGDRMLDHLADPGSIRIALIPGVVWALGAAGHSPGMMPSLFWCAWLAYGLSISGDDAQPSGSGAEGALRRSRRLARAGVFVFALWLALACADAALGGAASAPLLSALGSAVEAAGFEAQVSPRSAGYGLNAMVSAASIWVGFRWSRGAASAAGAAGYAAYLAAGGASGLRETERAQERKRLAAEAEADDLLAASKASAPKSADPRRPSL